MMKLNHLSKPPSLEETNLMLHILDLKGHEGSKMDFDLTFSMYGDFFAKLTNEDETKKQDGFCLRCYQQKKQFNILRVSAANMRDHIVRCHAELFNDDEKWVQAAAEVDAMFRKNVYKNAKRKRKRTSNAINKRTRTSDNSIGDPTAANTMKNMTLNPSERFRISRIWQSLFIICGGHPSTIVEDSRFKRFVQCLNSCYNPMSRNSQSNEEVLIYGYFLKTLKN